MSRWDHLPEHRSCGGGAARRHSIGRGCGGVTRGATHAPSPDPPWPRRGWASGERGAATLIALALSALVAIAVLVAADLGALAVARAQAQTAADLAALAAVTPADHGQAANRAGEVAAANGTRMTRCGCQPMEAVVGVRRRVLLVPFGVPVEVRAYARAVLQGPEPQGPAARR
jgi:secretion/DNA translocation related TadE-like protein